MAGYPAFGHKCDLHRFRKIAGGDKRNEAGTTGAFGFGFVSVYQITNNPELISAGQHWQLHPDASEDSRIQRKRVDPSFDGTRFIFPWAKDPKCKLRQKLGTPAIRQEDIEEFARKIIESIPQSLIFLRHLHCVEIKRNGILLKSLHRALDAGTVLISDGEQTTQWQVFTGDFDSNAVELKRIYSDHIEAKRQAKVAVAVCLNNPQNHGLFFATLPTQQQTYLPIHVNADFYPESNRKHLALESGYEEQWNRAAIEAAAQTLAAALPSLPPLLGASGLWTLISQVEEVHRDASQGLLTEHMTAFWNALKSAASKSKIIYTSTCEWCLPKEAVLLQEYKREEACLPILESLGKTCVHPELGKYRNLLTNLGISILSAFDLGDALVNNDLNKPLSIEEAPNWLTDPEQHRVLSDEVEILLERQKGQKQIDAGQKLADCTIARSQTNKFYPPRSLRHAPTEVVAIFEALGLLRYFAANDNPNGVSSLVKPLSAQDIAKLLEKVPNETWEQLWSDHPSTIMDVIALCERYRDKFKVDLTAQSSLKQLKIWPAKGTLQPLNELVVPGDFIDPLCVATVIDERVTSRYRKFLIEDLKAEVLTLEHYAGKLIPDRFRAGQRIEAAQCRKLLTELAPHIDRLRKQTQIRAALSNCPFIPCHDGKTRTANSVYFPGDGVSGLLGNDAPKVVLPDTDRARVEDFLKWLGVAEFPCAADVVARIQSFVQHDFIEPNRKLLQEIFGQLGRYWERYNTPEQRIAFDVLHTLRWLPVKGRSDRWYAPNEVHSLFRFYLFETTGQFLDVPVDVQRQSNDLIRFLRIQEPTPRLVCQHILNCAAANNKVNKEAYGFLNHEDHVDDPAIRQLKDHACLPLDEVGYVRPDQVFWSSHNFAPHFYTLSADFHAYRNLLNALDVKEEPVASDAIKLLCGIVDGNDNRRLSEQTHSVIMQCWVTINEALESERIKPNDLEPLRRRKVIPNSDGYLQEPGWMFIEDRPNLAARFGDFLKANVILPHPSTSLGMELAGVSSLSRVVSVVLVESTDAAPADKLQQILSERRPLIERIIHQARNSDPRWSTNLLERLEVQWCSRLEVGYQLKTFNQNIALPPEPAETYYDAQEEILFVQRSSDIPWLDIASGLASALNRHAEEGTIAPALVFALSASSLQTGNAVLNKLKIPPLQLDSVFAGILSAPMTMSGIEISDDEMAASEPYDGIDEFAESSEESTDTEEFVAIESGKEVANNSVNAPVQNDSTTEHPVTNSPASATSTAGNAHHSSNHGGASSPNRSEHSNGHGSTQGQTSNRREPQLRDPSAPRSQSSRTSTGTGQTSLPRSAPSHSSDERANPTGRMRTYVFSTSDKEADEVAEEARRNNTEPVDRAGMERVLAFEQEEGRIPEAMPHNNPGYDIYSLDAQGENERYIEVKSLSGNWNIKGVLISSTQFQFAR